jgi:trigger factor
MKLDIVSVGNSTKKLDVIVPVERVRAEFDRVYNQVGKGVKLHGFRPGKAPRRVLELKFGKQVASEVAGNLIQAAYSDAISNHGVEPVSRPAVEAGEIQASVDFTFTITVEVKPSLELQKYTGFDVVFPKVDVEDKEVDDLVKRRLEGAARLTEITDRAVAAGDLALVELTVKDGDEVVATEPGTMIRIDGDIYYPGVEGLLIGKAIGAEITGSATFSDKAKNEAVAGRTLDVTAKVTQIQATQIPDATDEIAEELGFSGGVVGMREALRAQLREIREGAARNQARANVLQALIDANHFDVPSGLVDQQLDALLQELRLQAAYRGQDPRRVTFDQAQMADLRIRAEFAAKGSLILDFLVKKESIAVTDGDIDARLQELADERGQTIEALRGYLKKDNGEEDFRARLLEEKALDWLLEHSNLVDAAPAAEAPKAEAAPKKGKSKKAEAEPEAAPAAAAGADLSVLDGAVGAIKDAVASGAHDAHLKELLAAEEGGKARKGAIQAIQARIAELG